MAVTADQYRMLSISSRRALGFAWAAAQHRAQGPQAVVEPADLLVGVLLAHPDSDGEGRVLLAHFGLTARDVLPENYPPLMAEDLRRHAAGISVDAPPPISPEVEQALATKASGEVQLKHVLGGLLHVSPSSDLYGRLEDRLSAAGTSLSALSTVYDDWLSGPSPEDGKPHAAGRMLQQTLDRQLPRRPVDVPTYCADRAGEGDDLIGIQREVDAFAYLLASKAQRPPLAVGLFGDWGSGKSFFMRAVRERIDTIQAQIADRKQAEVPFWKVVRQIEFNAWEYVRGTLWASLLDHIFTALDGRHIDLVNSRREELETARCRAAEQAAEQTKQRERLDGEISEADRALKEAERKRDQVLHEIENSRAQEIAKEFTAAARRIWGDAAVGLAGANATDLVAALGEARAEVLRGRGLLGPYWTTPKILGASLLALVVPGVALAADALDVAPIVSVLSALAALVPTVTTVLRSATRWTRERLDELDSVTRRLDQEISEKRHQLDAEVARAGEQLARYEAERAEAISAEQAALVQAQNLGYELAQLTPGRVLGEFLQERSRSDDYRRHLGLLAKVRDDLGKLEQLVRQNNESSEEPTSDAPPNRIVLYIDDLDRCPPDKVVEVLEAVHLLLAFELFVVVVAVDSRWLSHALTDELHALDTFNRGGRRATPQDYLEKIFQLPFWVQPLSPHGRRSLVHGLLEGSVRANGAADGAAGATPASALSVGPREEELLTTMLSRRGANPRLDAHLLALTVDDLRFMESLAPLLGDTPRRVKRFVNVTQLLLALPPSLEQDPNFPPDRQVVALLAAINSGLPGLAPKLFDAVEAAAVIPLLDAVNSLTGVPGDEREQLTTWLNGEPTWSALRLGRLATRLDVVRRLSFHREPALLAYHSPV